MAIYRKGSGGVAWKVLILSTGVLSAAMLLKLSAPLILEIAPVLYRGALEWLKPPYLYLLINCIIISIVASSKLHTRSDGDDDSPQEIAPIPHPPVKIIAAEFDEFDGVVSSGYGIVTVADPTKVVEEAVIEEPFDEVAMAIEDSSITEVPDLPPRSDSMELIDDEVAMATIEDSSSTEVVPDPPQRSDSMELSTNWSEKPPVSSRFPHRKALKSTPEGKGLRRVTKPKRHQDTLESTWRAITEGRGRPLGRHLKKSDTWHNDPNPTHDPPVKKSETFRDRGDNSTTLSSSSPQVSGKPRKEPSLSQDELNRRVEAFIEKFNEEMRLQRQESLNQYQAMMMGTLK